MTARKWRENPESRLTGMKTERATKRGVVLEHLESGHRVKEREKGDQYSKFVHLCVVPALFFQNAEEEE